MRLKNIRPFFMRDFFFEVAKRVFFFWVKSFSSFCPVKRGYWAGSSRSEFDYFRSGTWTSFPLIDRRIWENFGIAHLSIFLLEKKRWSNRAPFWWTVSFLTKQLKNELFIFFSQLRQPRIREADLGSSPRVIKLMPRRATARFPLFTRQKLLKLEEQRKKVCLQPQKKSPA